jgi:hypothetical protein
MPQSRLIDFGSYLTIALTLILFILALFLKGIAHDLLLEAGVFLVSAKLVIMTHKQALIGDELRAALQRIESSLEKRANGASNSRLEQP